jgi:hypothetical protein
LFYYSDDLRRIDEAARRHDALGNGARDGDADNSPDDVHRHGLLALFSALQE